MVNIGGLINMWVLMWYCLKDETQWPNIALLITIQLSWAVIASAILITDTIKEANRHAANHR